MLEPNFPSVQTRNGLSRRAAVRVAAAGLGCLLLASICPAPASGARATAAAAAPRFNAFPGYRPTLPSSTRLTNSQLADLNTQRRLERLTVAVSRIFDIVPPVPADPIPAGPLPGYQIVRLGRRPHNRLCFAATVAGTKGLMMLDTGVTNTALSNGAYRALLFNASARLPAGVPRAINLNGVSAPLAQAPDFRVSKVNLGTVPVCLVPRRYLSDAGAEEGGGQAYDGLLGQNILRHYNAMIDCAHLVMYLDLDPARKLDLASSFSRRGWTRVPMADTGSHFVVSCVLKGRRYRLVVDTGSPFTTLDRSLLKEAGVGMRDLPLRSGLIGTEAVPVSLVDLDRLQIGGYTATDVHLTATSQSLAAFGGRSPTTADAPVVGLLGGDLLARNGAIIDIGNRALYLRRVDRPASKAR